MMTTKKKAPIAPTTVRWTDSDSELLALLQEKTGIVSMSDLVRQAIRALAQKEGVAA